MTPARPLVTVLLTLIVAAASAGCLSEGDAPAGRDGATAPASTENATAPDEPVALYSFTGDVIGASPADLQDMEGGQVEQAPLAKRETFTVPDGRWELSIKADTGGGGGDARIEIYGPDGALVYKSLTWTTVGVPGAGVGLEWQTETVPDGPVPAGEYEVRYYVGGAFALTIDVSGTAVLPETADEA